jgi:branched-chain amino acid transport system permease protein
MAPTVMGLGPMGLLVTMVVVGGLGTVRGPIVGTFTVMILSELLRDVGMWRLVVLGGLLLLVLAFQPTGLDGLIARGVGKLRGWMNEEQRAKEKAEADSPGP